MPCVKDRFLSCLVMPIVAKNNISFNILTTRMIYDVNLCARNSELNVKSMLDYTQRHNSNQSVGIVGYDFEHDVCLCLRGGD